MATVADRSLVSRTVVPVGRFLAELGGMCAVMCMGGGVLSFAAFQIASWLGYPELVPQSLYLSIVIVTVCLSVPMAVYMVVRGHRRRHNRVMTGTTVGVGLAAIAMVWFGVIPTADLQTWRDVFGLVCGPACPLMVVEMLISFNMYSGRAHQRSHVA